MPVSLQDTLGDERFTQLPLDQQLKVLRENNSAFASLDPKDQGTVLYKAKKSFMPDYEPKEPQDAGFFSTLGSDIKGFVELPAKIRQTTGHPMGPMDLIHGMIDPQIDQFKQAGQTSGMESTGHALAGLIPGSGPIAALAGEEIGQGLYGQGGAHVLESLLPFLTKGVAENPSVQSFAGKVGDVTKAVAPDVAKAAVKGVGATVGSHFGEGGRWLVGYPLVRSAIKDLGSAVEKGKSAIAEDSEVPEGLKKSVESQFVKNPNIQKKYNISQSSGQIGDKAKSYKVRKPGVREDFGKVTAEDSEPEAPEKEADSPAVKMQLGTPERPGITDYQKDQFTQEMRTPKVNTIAKHIVDNDIDYDKMNPAAKKAVFREAGYDPKVSLDTDEQVRRRVQYLKKAKEPD